MKKVFTGKLLLIVNVATFFGDMYMTSYLLGIDLGTSACRAVIFTLEGKKISEASMEYPVYHPQPRWAEQKPLEWWNATVKVIQESIRKANIKGEEITGLSIASQREAIVPISKEGRELYNSIIWLDNRTIPQTEKIRSIIGEDRVLSITGLPVNPIYSASKILWIKENLPNVFEETAYFLCAKDYIIYKLTGEVVTDYSMASRTMLFDVKRKKWSEEICRDLGISISMLPIAKEASEVVGEVSSEASKETFLPKGLPVVNGGGDRPCECLGAGVTRPGSVNIGTGTGSLFEVPLNQPLIDMKGRVPCCCHVIPETWEYEVVIGATGAVLRWFRDTFGVEEKLEAKKTGRDAYDLLIEKAAEINPGSEGLFFYPYLTGAFLPRCNERARGVFFGINLSHNKGHFVRALLEGIAFQYLEALKILNELKMEVQDVSMVGGEAKSDIWNQIKADIFGREIKIPKVDNAAALGAVMLAGTGTGQYTSLFKAAEEIVEIEKSYKPSLDKQKIYSKIYQDYMKVYSHIERGFDIY